MKYAVIYEKTATGYSAYVPDLPGCAAAGPSLEETTDLIRGAVEMHLDAMREDGDAIPVPTTEAGYVAIPAWAVPMPAGYQPAAGNQPAPPVGL